MAALKRRFSRLALEFPARVIIGSAPPFEVTSLTNIAIGGCLIPVEQEVAVGTSVEITIPLAENISIEKIQVSGSVVRCEEGFLAVRFEQITPPSLNHLQKLILYNSSDPEKIEEEIKEHPGLV